MSTELPLHRRSSPPPLKSASFDQSPLLTLVSGTRRWLRLAGAGRLLAWLALAGCGAIALDLSSESSPSTRASFAGLIALVGAILAIDAFWRRPRKINTRSATQEVETTHPEFGQILRTARDFSKSKNDASPVLKNELFRRAGILLAGLDLSKQLPRRPAFRWLAAGGVAFVGFVAFLIGNSEAPTALARLVAPFSGITFTRVENTTHDATFNRNRLPRIEAKTSGRRVAQVVAYIKQPEGSELSFPMNPMGNGRYEATLPASETSFTFRIEAGDSNPATGSMECIDPAELVSSSAELALPDYTGQPATTQDTADIETVEGTTATLHFKMSAPMTRASLKLPNGNKIPLTVDGDTLSAKLTVKIGGDIAELSGTDARGHDIETTQFHHKGFEDKLPVVEWIEPTKDIDATAVAELPLRLRLRDDFGVASYGVVLEARGESKEIMTRTIEAKDLRDLSEMTSAALESFPLTIRDNVRLYAWATDHKPRDNARAVSKLRGVDIRPFKRKWQMLTGTMSGPPIPPEDLLTVEKLIKTQRAILSDAFAIIQGPPTAPETVKALGDQETKLQQDGSIFHKDVVAEGKWPADDINLLQAAVTQMGESANSWLAIQPKPGFERGDAALSTLLELRKNLLTLLVKANCPCLDPKPEEVPNKLADLAAEAERLAKEERDVSGQLGKQLDDAHLAPIRRQQDVANSDTGELYSRLMDHPEATPLVLSHMADAEKSVRDATRTTTSNNVISAAPPQLDAAATALDEVAKHLRALDEQNLDETLAQMSAEAKKAAEAAKPKDEGEKPDEQAGDKPADKPGEGEKPAQAAGKKPGEGKSPSDKPGQGKGEGKGQGEGQGAGQGEGQGLAQGEGKGEGQGNSPSDKPGDAEAKTPGQGKGDAPGDQKLAANDPNAGNSSTPGEKAGSKPGDGPGTAAGNAKPKDAATERKEALAKAARQAETNDDVLKFMANNDADAELATRFKSLREQTATDKLEDKLKDAAAGKTDGTEAAGDLKALSAALEKEREIRRQSRLDKLEKNREMAAALKKEAETRRDASRNAAKEIEKANNGEFSFDPPKDVIEKAREASNGNGKGDKPGQGKGAGKGDKPSPNGKSGGAPGNGPGHGTPGEAARELAKNIDALKDTELSRIARELENTPVGFSDVKPLADAERRLTDMIEEISGLARGDDSAGSVPPAYRRTVEDYYRSLSDDFGDEEAVPR
ncbi:MAG: hypothetical protein ABI162_11340 [Luteolibacter sp.]